MRATDQANLPAVLLIATLDTKSGETLYLKEKMESLGCRVLLMDTGILEESGNMSDVDRHQVAKAGGSSIREMIASGDKGGCIGVMRKGACVLAKRLFDEGKFQGILSIGGAQGTDIGTAAMRELPFGVPKFMVSTVASGRATFGPYVGTKDIILMHSVADIQGINFMTRRVFDNAAAAVCGMVRNGADESSRSSDRVPVALSMLGTITQGAMRAKSSFLKEGTTPLRFIRTGRAGSPWKT